jgi:hypothetical protein
MNKVTSPNQNNNFPEFNFVTTNNTNTNNNVTSTNTNNRTTKGNSNKLLDQVYAESEKNHQNNTHHKITNDDPLSKLMDLNFTGVSINTKLN